MDAYAYFEKAERSFRRGTLKLNNDSSRELWGSDCCRYCCHEIDPEEIANVNVCQFCTRKIER